MNKTSFYYAQIINGKPFLCCSSHSKKFQTKSFESAQDLASKYNTAKENFFSRKLEITNNIGTNVAIS